MNFEIKNVNCALGEENEVISFYSKLGYEFISSQVIHNERQVIDSSKWKTGYGWVTNKVVYSSHTVVNEFVVLSFKRQCDLPNIEKIRKIEVAINSLPEIKPYSRHRCGYLVPICIGTSVIAILGMSNIANSFLLGIFLLTLGIVLSIVIPCLVINSVKNRNNKNYEKYVHDCKLRQTLLEKYIKDAECCLNNSKN